MNTRWRTVLYAFGIAACLTGTVASAESQFVTLDAPERLEVREKVNASAGTMSGAHAARIRANALIASLFLLKSESEASVQLGKFKIAPIVVPADVQRSDDTLRLCTTLNTTNGHYELIGFADIATLVAPNPVSGLVDLIFETKHNNTISNRYGDKSFVGRTFIATACAARQTFYYMPISFSDEPDTLNITFEVTDGTVAPVLHAVGTDGTVTAEGVPMKCVATRRLAAGFDCEANFDVMRAEAEEIEYSGLMELHLKITNGRDASSYATRISVPLQ